MTKPDKRLLHPTPMHGPITQSFLDQVVDYNFLFHCEDCAFFDEAQDRCVHGYPDQPHRRAYFAGDALGKVLIFCREFEINDI